MFGIKIQQSKDAFCDYLLVKSWQNYLRQMDLEIGTDKGYNLTERINIINDFMKNIEYLYSTNVTDLAQFGIKSSTTMQQYLQQAYKNLQNNHVSF